MSHRNKTLFITLAVMLTGGLLFGQLEDISRKIPSHVVQMERMEERFVLTGKSETYSSGNTPEGVAVLLDRSTMEMEALFRFLELDEIDFSQLGILGKQFFNFSIQFPFIG